MLDDGANQYLYNADGHVCAVRDMTYGGMTGYLYNASGQRVAKGTLTAFSCNLTPDTTTGLPANGFALNRESVLGPSGEQLAELARDENGRMAWHHTNVYAAGALFASYDPNGLHFLDADWLGTTRAPRRWPASRSRSCTPAASRGVPGMRAMVDLQTYSTSAVAARRHGIALCSTQFQLCPGL